MAILRTDIERALDELASQEEGMRFQGLAVVLGKKRAVFAPNSAHRARVTPSKRGKGNKASTVDAPEDTTPAERRAAMRLKLSA